MILFISEEEDMNKIGMMRVKGYTFYFTFPSHDTLIDSSWAVRVTPLSMCEFQL